MTNELDQFLENLKEFSKREGHSQVENHLALTTATLIDLLITPGFGAVEIIRHLSSILPESICKELITRATYAQSLRGLSDDKVTIAVRVGDPQATLGVVHEALQDKMQYVAHGGFVEIYLVHNEPRH